MSDGKQPLDFEINLRRLVWLTFGLVGLVVVAAIAMWFFSLALRNQGIAADPAPPLLEEARLPYEPPAPRLQKDPIRELAELRASEERELSSWGWVDESNGIARIPIDRAVDLVVEQGLPGPSPAIGAPTGNATGEPGS